ncbi:MAG: DedA family protein [Aequoribacter sp.]|uniref:DedA family protein n=1 Tax=Aequoribacter sp. TaxID=2847771 RepID=UPI003C33FCDA
MNTLIDEFTYTLTQLGPSWGMGFVVALAFMEACPGLGLFVSGVLLLTTATALYANDVLTLQQISLAAFAGAIVADHLGFYLGRYLGPTFHHSNFAQKYSARITRAESALRRFGAAAVPVGRFIPAIRSITPTLLGLSGVSRAYFSVVDVLACALWAVALGALASGITLVIQ